MLTSKYAEYNPHAKIKVCKIHLHANVRIEKDMLCAADDSHIDCQMTFLSMQNISSRYHKVCKIRPHANVRIEKDMLCAADDSHIDCQMAFSSVKIKSSH